MNKQFLLFDVDRTLLDFDRSEEDALSHSLRQFSLPHSREIRIRYAKINDSLWAAFEKGEIQKETILYRRFAMLFSEYGISCDAKEFDAYYRSELGKRAFLIDGAMDVLHFLKERGFGIYYLTNGTRSVQRPRLRDSGLEALADGIFISEEIGFQKPEARYFERVFSQIPAFQKKAAILIGDSLSSDIRGGVIMGIDTVWYNPQHKENHSNLPVTHEISDLEELIPILDHD